MNKQLYYVLNESKFCTILYEHGDMVTVRYSDGSVSLGDIHKSRLIKV